jgi:hypothetical protein
LIVNEKNVDRGEEMRRNGDEDEGLVGLAFVSRVADGLPSSVFLRLARQSWSFNTRMGLTGELVLDRGRFVQVIEGSCSTVQALAARILADPRHDTIEIRAFGPLAARRHAGWTLVGFDFEPPLDAPLSAPGLVVRPPSRLVAAAVQGAGSF